MAGNIQKEFGYKHNKLLAGRGEYGTITEQMQPTKDYKAGTLLKYNAGKVEAMTAESEACYGILAHDVKKSESTPISVAVYFQGFFNIDEVSHENGNTSIENYKETCRKAQIFLVKPEF